MSTNCPLADPSLDIVPINSHQVGGCLCQFCTCGKHLCPSMKTKEPFPRGTFTTKYMADYKKIRFESPVKPEPRLYRPNKQPMDLATTNKEDFQNLKVKPATAIKPQDHTWPSKPGISSSTVNSYNYPNWGTNSISHEKRWHPPVRTTEIPFKGKSSYSRSFSPILPNETAPYKTNYFESTAYQNNFKLGPNTGFDDRTTYSDKMKNYSNTGLNSRIKVRAPKAEVLQATPSHFSTTMNSFYKAPNHKIDPRQLKIKLESRGL